MWRQQLKREKSKAISQRDLEKIDSLEKKIAQAERRDGRKSE
jgi:hypothetical protein